MVKLIKQEADSKYIILLAAQAEFALHGLSGARVDSIAVRAGLNKRLIYYYFRSKDQLFLEVLEHAYSEIRRAEQEVANEQKNNEFLKIKEAELKSLYHIEEESKQLDMVDSANIKYLEETPSVAYGRSDKE